MRHYFFNLLGNVEAADLVGRDLLGDEAARAVAIDECRAMLRTMKREAESGVAPRVEVEDAYRRLLFTITPHDIDPAVGTAFAA